jgi:hypothetical protein
MIGVTLGQHKILDLLGKSGVVGGVSGRGYDAGPGDSTRGFTGEVVV